MDQVIITPANEDQPVPATDLSPLPIAAAFDDVQGIVIRALEVARAAGRDYVAQSHFAAEAVLAVRHDLSFSEALNAVYRMRESDAA